MGTHYTGPPEQRTALDAFIKLTRAAESVEARAHGTLRGQGLTVSQFGVLEALYHLGPLCQGELAGKLLKSGGNLTTVVDNLERRGWVERQRGEGDRRFVRRPRCSRQHGPRSRRASRSSRTKRGAR